MSAVGVASPSAQGQAMTSTVTVESKARVRLPPGSLPKRNQSKPESNASAMMVGTKIAATLSTMF